VDRADHLSTETTAVAEKRFKITFPREESASAGYAQDEEWCEVLLDGEQRRIRFHDYSEIFGIPGLYEQLFYDELKCDSPRTVATLLGEHMEAQKLPSEELRVLDVGAGNGMVGEELRKLGVAKLVGIDIIEAAAEATERDRPGVYDDFLVADLTNLSPDQKAELQGFELNCLSTVAALGFGDIPPDAFASAYNLIAPGGWVAFNLKDEFFEESDGSGFQRLIRRGLDEGALEIQADRRYRHRLAVSGEPLNYVALIAKKHRDLPLGQA
jgi:predicted TPR repeat methyltransferase